MRRSIATSSSSLTALNAAFQAPPVSPFLLLHRSTRGQSQSQSQSLSLSLIRLLAVISIIGSQFRGVLCTTTAAHESTTASSSGSNGTQSTSTENNNLLFDDHNTTKAVSSTAVNPAAAAAGAAASTATTLYVSQMPAETIPSILDTSSQSKASSSMSTPDSNEISPSAPIKNLITNSNGSTDLHPTGLTTTAAATPKSARSTIKQPIDSTRSRNHWTVGGASAYDTERPRTFRSKHHHEHHWGPFFEEPLNTAATGENLVSAVHLFTEAVLNCRVGMLKDKTVMWVRRTTEKVSLLTVGNVTYSGDPRIRVKFQYPNNWRLLINPTQREDAGIYMCQVSTHPPRVFTTNLTILEPPLRIIDEHERDVGDRYYKSGSTVDLQCQISRHFFQKERYNILKSTESMNSIKSNPTTTLANNETANALNLIGDTNQTQLKLSSQELEKYFTNFITWAKDEESLQALTNRRSSVSDKWLTSRITIPDATLSDSGNYSCSLGRLFAVIVQVQVLTGELPAAVQHNSATKPMESSYFTPWCLFPFIILTHLQHSLATY